MDHTRIIDSHCHIFPEKIAAKATAAIGDFYGIPMDEVGSAARLTEEMEKAGIDLALVCSTATKPEQVSSINRFIHDAAEASGGRFYGFGTLHQDMTDEEIGDELERIGTLGLHGIKLHSDFQKFYIDDERMIPVYRELARRNLPVLFHMGDERTEYSTPERLQKVARAVPDLLSIAAHLGGYSVWDRAEILAGEENVVFDSSSSLPMLTKERALWQIGLFGIDRIFFGSDFPMWKPDEEIERVHALGLGEEQEELLFHRNFERWILGKQPV